MCVKEGPYQVSRIHLHFPAFHTVPAHDDNPHSDREKKTKESN